jgi:hypothetical protein
MEGSFVPECYFDTVLVRYILQAKTALNHKKGCNNVVKEMRDGKLKDSFAVGIVDRDKKELDYLGEFDRFGFDKLNLYKHKSRHHYINHYIIQLDPPIEKWIMKVAEEAGIDLKSLGLPTDVDKLKKLTKSELARETKELGDLCKALLKSKSATIRRFARWIRYLKQNTYKTDINHLING